MLKPLIPWHSKEWQSCRKVQTRNHKKPAFCRGAWWCSWLTVPKESTPPVPQRWSLSSPITASSLFITLTNEFNATITPIQSFQWSHIMQIVVPRHHYYYHLLWSIAILPPLFLISLLFVFRLLGPLRMNIRTNGSPATRHNPWTQNLCDKPCSALNQIVWDSDLFECPHVFIWALSQPMPLSLFLQQKTMPGMAALKTKGQHDTEIHWNTLKTPADYHQKKCNHPVQQNTTDNPSTHKALATQTGRGGTSDKPTIRSWPALANITSAPKYPVPHLEEHVPRKQHHIWHGVTCPVRWHC